MPPIERVDASECVANGLRAIADFGGSDFEDFTFSHWHEFHKAVFINVVVACIRKKGSRLALNEKKLNAFATVGALIDHVHRRSIFLGEPEKLMRVADGDLRQPAPPIGPGG